LKKIVFILFSLLIIANLQAVQIKELAKFSLDKDNFLYGKGVVIGLNGTGDRIKATNIALNNFLYKQNLKTSLNDIRTKNAALVMLSGTVKSFLKKGDRFDVSVSSMGDAKTLKNGILSLSTLKGPDGKIYAICKGKLNVTGNNNSGIIPNGCIVEREINNQIINRIKLNLHFINRNLEAIYKAKKKINKTFGFNTASSVDYQNLILTKPETYDTLDFIYKILNLNLDMVEKVKIIVDKNNKILISGENVLLKNGIISGKDFNIKIGDFDLRPYSKVIKTKKIKGKKEPITPTIGNLISSLQEINVPFDKIIKILYHLQKNHYFDNEIIIK